MIPLCATCLDEHNGIDLHDGRGYHYHVTAQAGPWGHLMPVFPYVLGPTYAGQLQPNATYTPDPRRSPARRRPRRSGRRQRHAGCPVPDAGRAAVGYIGRADEHTGGAAAHRNTDWADGHAGGADGDADPSACPTQFNDVDGANPFYLYIQWMACRGYISGYPCGGPGEPCPGAYFRPGNMVTRGQLLKMVVNAAGWAIVTPGTPTFADVAASDAFYPYIETGAEPGDHQRVSVRGAGGAVRRAGNRPYFRPGAPITRGQLSKVIALARGYPLPSPPAATFGDVPVGIRSSLYVEAVYTAGIVSGYPCGGIGEPCPGVYFRPGNAATRGQVTKFVTLAYGGPVR